jgi:hypothetical protein
LPDGASRSLNVLRIGLAVRIVRIDQHGDHHGGR